MEYDWQESYLEWREICHPREPLPRPQYGASKREKHLLTRPLVAILRAMWVNAYWWNATLCALNPP